MHLITLWAGFAISSHIQVETGFLPFPLADFLSVMDIMSESTGWRANRGLST